MQRIQFICKRKLNATFGKVLKGTLELFILCLYYKSLYNLQKLRYPLIQLPKPAVPLTTDVGVLANFLAIQNRVYKQSDNREIWRLGKASLKCLVLIFSATLVKNILLAGDLRSALPPPNVG